MVSLVTIETRYSLSCINALKVLKLPVQAEMAHTCRGTISLHGAVIHTENYSCNFVVSNGGGTQTFHLRSSSEVERQKWVTALELAKAKAIQVSPTQARTWLVTVQSWPCIATPFILSLFQVQAMFHGKE